MTEHVTEHSDSVVPTVAVASEATHSLITDDAENDEMISADSSLTDDTSPNEISSPSAAIVDPQQQALLRLAAELHRPPVSLAAFSQLTAEQLNWLSARAELICLREDARIREELHRTIPRFLRPLLLRRLRTTP